MDWRVAAVSYWNKSMLSKEYCRLAQAIRSGAIALLSATWLIDFVYSKSSSLSPTGNAIPRRQDLPPEAFLPVDTLILLGRRKIKIIALSYMWLSKLHPDPHGDMLSLLAKTFKTTLRAKPHGIFWDYCSLHQHAPDGTRRNEEEERLFWQGLGALADLYAHPDIETYQIKEFPSTFDSSTETPYERRGWPFAESCWAAFSMEVTKSTELKYPDPNSSNVPWPKNSPSVPPLLPNEFERQLEFCKFTNDAEDRPRIVELYQEFFSRFPSDDASIVCIRHLE